MPIWAKLLQPAPWQRSIRYCAIVPPVSVAAPQLRLTAVTPAALAVSVPGAEGVAGAPAPAALKVAICISHGPPGAEAVAA